MTRKPPLIASRARVQRRAGAAAVALVILLGACSSSRHQGAPPGNAPAVKTVAQRLATLRRLLPAGFSAPGTDQPPGSPTPLRIAPASRLDPASMHIAPFPTEAALRPALAAIVNQPLPLAVRPVLVDVSEIRPDAQVTIAATHLGTAPHHAALVILDGPNFRAEHLLSVGNRVAAGVVTMPSHLASGTWYIVVQDLSEVKATTNQRDHGTVLVDIGSFVVH